MRHSITWKPQDEKRWIIPVKQAATVAFVGSALAMLAIDLFAIPTDKPLEAAVFTGGALGLGWMLRQFEDANHPRKTKLAPVLAHASETHWYGTTVNGEKRGVSMTFRFPVDEPARWKIFCYRAAFEKVPLSVNHWTTNAGDNPKAIFSKKEFKEIIKVLLQFQMAENVYQRSSNGGRRLTDLGTRYCRHVISHQKMLTPDEWYFIYAPFPTGGNCADNQLGVLRASSKQAHVQAPAMAGG